ncbi:cytochrome P450 9e2-like [Microplitis mediator]|uniref:cytochrome P450 9e2-like n=1 Tax=Microplitis mediator TaxID=375433 RepID=UPI0025579B8C|nr:cytochrome P450 9e2-like [Microplitis mediator]
MLYYLITLIITLLIIKWVKIKDKFSNTSIPYIKPWPIFGNMAEPLFRKISLAEHLQKFYNLNKTSKYFGFYDFNSPVIVIRDPELVREVGIKSFDNFTDHRGFADPGLDLLFSKNLFSLRGDEWREIRNLLSPAFTSSKMKTMFKLMRVCSENFVNYFHERAKSQLFTLRTKDAFTRYTNDVIASCAYGITVDSLRDPDNKFYEIGRKSTNFDGILSLKFFCLRSFPNLFKLLRIKLFDKEADDFFLQVVSDTIKARDQGNIYRPDMIQLMMESRSSSKELTIQDMTAQAFIFFAGGFDTTSGFLCFVAHELAENIQIQEKLRQEVDEVHDKFDGMPSYEAINGMKYLEAVLNETMRLYPIAPFADRVCVKDYELPSVMPGEEKYLLKTGDCVWFPVYPIHRDPDHYSEPDKFNPDRFLDNGIITSNSPTYIPFGIGPRMCIGNRFALLETKILFFYLIRKCFLKPSKKMVRPMRLSKNSFTMTAEGGFWVDIESRF